MSTVKVMLAELRKEKRITQSELANFLCVSFQYGYPPEPVT